MCFKKRFVIPYIIKQDYLTGGNNERRDGGGGIVRGAEGRGAKGKGGGGNGRVYFLFVILSHFCHFLSLF